MAKQQICAKCHKKIPINSVRRLDGKPYHYDCREQVLGNRYDK